MLGITESSFYFKSMSIPTKMDIEEDIRDISIEVNMTHPYRNFFLSFNKTYTVLAHLVDSTVFRYTGKVHRLFVPKFYHDRKDTNFLKNLKYVGEKAKIDEKDFSEITEFGRKLYEYNSDPNHTPNIGISTKTMDWPFPEEDYKSIGYTVHGFKFAFLKVKTSISNIINTKNNLINIENGLEKAINAFNSELFFPSKKNI